MTTTTTATTTMLRVTNHWNLRLVTATYDLRQTGTYDDWEQATAA